MFRYMAEDIAFMLIKCKVADIGEREIYVFGLEVLLLNSVNVLMALITSLVSGTMWHFMAYLLFFVPLRIFTGGYHAKKSEICFVISALVYIASVLVARLYPQICDNSVIALLLLVAVISLTMILAPVVNSKNPLSESECKRNKLVSVVLVTVDSVAYIVLECLGFYSTSSIIIFLIINTVMMLLGIAGNFSDKQHKFGGFQ